MTICTPTFGKPMLDKTNTTLGRVGKQNSPTNTTLESVGKQNSPTNTTLESVGKNDRDPKPRALLA